MEDLNSAEIVAVLAHEIGHYKMKHMIYGITIAIAVAGFELWVLSIFLNNPGIAYALGGTAPSFHLGMVGFSLLWSPMSDIFDLVQHYLSRKHEYQADRFAADHGMGSELISALKKTSSKSLSNLTPHPLVVFCCDSHPTLLQRIHSLNIDANANVQV